MEIDLQFYEVSEFSGKLHVTDEGRRLADFLRLFYGLEPLEMIKRHDWSDEMERSPLVRDK